MHPLLSLVSVSQYTLGVLCIGEGKTRCCISALSLAPGGEGMFACVCDTEESEDSLERAMGPRWTGCVGQCIQAIYSLCYIPSMWHVILYLDVRLVAGNFVRSCWACGGMCGGEEIKVNDVALHMAARAWTYFLFPCPSPAVS